MTLALQLSEIKREGIEFVDALKASSKQSQLDFAQTLVAEAKASGLNMKDYLNWKINLSASEEGQKFANAKLSGYQATLARLNLPIRNDLENGVSLQAASSTFQQYAGTRILFPQVIDDVASFQYRQTNFETLDAILGNRRSINGTEVLYMVVDDKEKDYQKARAVTERGQVPIYKIEGKEQTVKIYTFGMGWSFTYEFDRRASIDLITPYANRSKAEVQRSKVWMGVETILNGDGAYGACPEVNQSSFNDANTTGTATNGKLSYKHLIAWLVARAKAGVPVDTVIGNFDAYIQWLFMFALPSTDKNMTDAQQMAAAGFQIGGVPMMNGVVNFALATNVPSNKLIGISKGFTLEELEENGSKIEESERSITTREVTYVNTECSGFRLPFGDTRQVYNFGA